MSFLRYPAYKDSGVKWLGNVPSHWDCIKSRRLFALRGEKARPDDRQLTASQKYGVIYQEDFMTLEGQKVMQVTTGVDILKHVEPNDFVISMRSFQGGIEWCRHRGCVSSAYVALIPSANTDGKFFSYLFKSKPYIQALQSTSNLVRDGQALRYENFTLVDLPVVPLSEQRAIAAFLDAETARIDALVAKQEALIVTLQEKRRALITHTVTKGIDPAAPMRDSGVPWLGEVPAHWEVKRFRYCCEVTEGQIDPKGERFNDRILIAPNHIESGTGRLIYTETAAEQGAISGKYPVKPGDVIYSKIRPALNKVCMSKGDWLCSADMYPIQGKRGMTAEYIFYFLLSDPFVTLMVEESMRVAMPKVNRETLADCPFPVPPAEEQLAIARYISSETTQLDTLTAKAQALIDLLREHRTALIAAAVTGQIDVLGYAGAS